MNVTLGANLRAIRLARGRSQQDFAHDLGYDRTYVASVERGERNLTLDTVSDLAERLGVDALGLLQDSPSANRPAVSEP
ncbi:MAG: helix-turn-helix transcriptional regulator [Actinobacteria bacterium]|nr:helix-turn-helix transcriptional regulator [Actinomycetota bacterium]